jgi:hypothetical protein
VWGRYNFRLSWQPGRQPGGENDAVLDDSLLA